MVIPVTFMSRREARAAQDACRAPGNVNSKPPVLVGLCQPLLMFSLKCGGQETGESQTYNLTNLASSPHLHIL